MSVVEGNGITALIDTGMESVDQMNHMAGFLMSELITREQDEDTGSILNRAGVPPNTVDLVFLTHNHYDHCSNLPMFDRAMAVVPRRAWSTWHEEPDGAIYLHEGYLDYLESLRDEGRIELLDEGLVAPGLGVRWVGGHCVCSQFIYVNTTEGVALFSGDTVQMYGNVEYDDPIAICEDEEQCRRAIGIAQRDADILVPGHDPLVLERFADGIVA
jgi:glyoxylase-like metal-dependent hydrolase (beta-lactamase superfamily II)